MIESGEILNVDVISVKLGVSTCTLDLVVVIIIDWTYWEIVN